MADLRRTPLWDCHREAGARLVEFAGYEMPVQYAGVIDEHRAVRGAAGLFDVSHMGEVRVSGSGAEAFIERLTPNSVAKLKPGRAHYSGLLTEEGGYIDDLLVYRIASEEFLLVVNAANREEDFAWIRSHAPEEGVELEDVSDRYALLALQGPKAVEILAPLASIDVAAIRYYRFAMGEVDGVPTLISRTGYTGEDGFELYLDPSAAERIWNRLFETGASAGLAPAGLGARDTLRLEAGMALYGHELDRSTSPYEAGLAWVVKLASGEFIGRDALVAQKESGAPRTLIGFEIEGRGIARQGHEVLDAEGQAVGVVTSGTWSPTFEKALGMAYVPTELAHPGASIGVSVRGRTLPAKIVELPFYKRPK